MAIILFPKKNYKKQGQMFFRNYSLALLMGVATNSELGGGGRRFKLEPFLYRK